MKPQKLHETVSKKIFEEVLDFNTSGIERIHHLGYQKPNDDDDKSRPVILKLLDYHGKVTILEHCSRLKGSGYSISEDFSRPVREIRKKLWEKTKANRDRKEKVFLVYDKARIGGRLFAWDSNSNDIVDCEKNEEHIRMQTRSARNRSQQQS